MRISVEEVFETVKMTLDHHFDIRTVTLGINLKDCIDRNIDGLINPVFWVEADTDRRVFLYIDSIVISVE